jgi:hypothetical protein
MTKIDFLFDTITWGWMRDMMAVTTTCEAT